MDNFCPKSLDQGRKYLRHLAPRQGLTINHLRHSLWRRIRLIRFTNPIHSRPNLQQITGRLRQNTRLRPPVVILYAILSAMKWIAPPGSSTTWTQKTALLKKHWPNLILTARSSSSAGSVTAARWIGLMSSTPHYRIQLLTLLSNKPNSLSIFQPDSITRLFQAGY